MRTRNPDIYIEIGEQGWCFAGNLSNWEDNFGYLSNFSDEELIDYIKEWGEFEFNCNESTIHTTFNKTYWENEISKLPINVLKFSLNAWKNGDYKKCSYQPQVLECIQNEITKRS